MANRGHGWLYISEENGETGELVNHARTAAYLQSSAILGCSDIHGVLDDGGCEAYTWTPDDDGDWTQKVFTNPEDDEAPWYNSAYPESAQALGFWITEMTGLDSGHVRRTSTPVGSYRGGSVLSAPSNSGRVIGVEMLMLAESERAMEYLFQWFDSVISSVCSTCETDTVLIRRFCPDIDAPEDSVDGVVELRGVGLAAGMVYGEDPVEQAGCFLRRVNFTLEATDPCMYSLCTGEVIDQFLNWTECFNGLNAVESREQCRPDCSEIPSSCRAVYDYTITSASASAPVVTLTVPGPATNIGGTFTETIPLRIRTYANPYGYGPSEICGAPLIAELYLAALPAYSEIKYDMAGRKVQYRDATSGDWVNGFAFVAPNEPGIPRFAALGCGDYTTVIEPADYCVTPTALADMDSPSLTDGVIYDLAMHPDWGYLVGGDFAGFAGEAAHTDLGAVTLTGVRNPEPWVTMTGTTRAVVVQHDKGIVVSGAFTTFVGNTVNRIMRLTAAGTWDTAWSGVSNQGLGTTYAVDMLVQSDGKLVLVGAFTTVRGNTQYSLGRLDTDGTHDTAFNAANTAFTSGSTPLCMGAQSDGKIVIAGSFTNAFGVAYNSLVRVDGDDGTEDATFNTGANPGVTGGAIRGLVVQPDDKIIIVGNYTNARGVAKNGLARLNTDGSLDTTFNVGGTVGVAGNNMAKTVALLSDGTIIVGGDFTSARGTTVGGLVRLTALGTIHPDWESGTAGISGSEFIESVLVDAVDRIVVGGQYANMSGEARDNGARIFKTGLIDPSFPSADGLYAYYPAQMVPTSSLSVQERMGCV